MTEGWTHKMRQGCSLEDGHEQVAKVANDDDGASEETQAEQDLRLHRGKSRSSATKADGSERAAELTFAARASGSSHSARLTCLSIEGCSPAGMMMVAAAALSSPLTR